MIVLRFERPAQFCQLLLRTEEINHEVPEQSIDQANGRLHLICLFGVAEFSAEDAPHVAKYLRNLANFVEEHAVWTT